MGAEMRFEVHDRVEDESGAHFSQRAECLLVPGDERHAAEQGDRQAALRNNKSRFTRSPINASYRGIARSMSPMRILLPASTLCGAATLILESGEAIADLGAQSTPERLIAGTLLRVGNGG